ncbi:uncharacterized protein ZBIST_2904 [Zygosaccharomyces bailii]|nr:uncharacterized protein ZBIST_2904 [Zygosaccharomyces bailii]
MRCTNVIRASLSPNVYLTRRAFDKQLNTLPSTAFHYYCQLQVDHLTEPDPQLKRHIRREWDLLSVTKKRLYYAFYFHFKGINHRKMNKFEFAKFLEIPTPASSEYMLFRNTFKYKFEMAWIDNLKRQRTTGRGQVIKHATITGGHRLTVYAQLNNLRLQQEAMDYTSRYQQMCRECRRVWKEKVSLKQRIVIRDKWEEQKQIFEERIRNEIDALEINLNRLTHFDLRREFYDTVELCRVPLKKK